MPPRYQCHNLANGWSWRLLGANNRTLARSVRSFTTVADAVADSRAIADRAEKGRIDILNENGTMWRWVFFLDREARAISAGAYVRRLECTRAADRFRTWASRAQQVSEPAVFPSLPRTASPITEREAPGTKGIRPLSSSEPLRSSPWNAVTGRIAM
jgi:hypothetical protein